MSDNELIQKAIEMRSQALAPYSNYKVGNTNSKLLMNRAKEAYENNQKKNPNLNKKIEELDKLVNQ